MRRALTSICVALFWWSLPATAGAQSMRLSEALARGMAQNRDLAAARVRTKSSSIAQTRAREPFIPQATADVSYADDSNYIDGRNRLVRNAAGLFWELPVGTQLALAASSSWPIDGVAGTPRTSLGFDVSQPLLAGAWGHGNDLEALGLERRIQTASLESQTEDVLLDIELAYWELSNAQYNVEISRRSVERAKQQFEDTRENIKMGLLAEGDIYVVEENLVFFQQQLIRAGDALQASRARLARLLHLQADSEVSASEDPLAFGHQLPSDVPVEDHPRMRAQRARVEQASVRAADARQNRLPTLDVRAGVSLDGVSEPTSAAWGETFTAEHPNFQVGVFAAVPLSFAARDARVEAADLAAQEAKIEYERVERLLLEDRATTANSLAARREVFELAKRRAELSLLKLETEVDKYRNGVSRLPEVVRFQRDVDSAELAKIRARIDVLTLEARLLHALAALRSQYGLEAR